MSWFILEWETGPADSAADVILWYPGIERTGTRARNAGC